MANKTVKVTLRQKPAKGRMVDLYLDYYPAIPHYRTGKLSRRESLRMQLYSEIEVEKQSYLDANGKQQIRTVPVLDSKGQPKKAKLTPFEKQHNQNTLQTALQVCQKKQNELNKSEIYSELEKQAMRARDKGERDFVAYFKSLGDKRKASTYDNWVSAYHYLVAFTGGSLKFADLDETFCNNFMDYLLTAKSKRSDTKTLAQNSALSYYNRFKAALKQAFKDGIIQTDLRSRIGNIKPEDTQRNFLTESELKKLATSKCDNPLLKKAALFSALTGLRFSDIQKLTWGEIEQIGEIHYLRFRQQKTQAAETHPISTNAYKLLGERKGLSDRVFDGLEYSAYQNKHLLQWLMNAGIVHKKITFHCFRHTYAMGLMEQNERMEVVQKMMGHRNIKTTAIMQKY